MSEGALLSLVARYPHPIALARHARDGTMFVALRRLEARELVTRRRGLYRLTRRGRHELALARALARLVNAPAFTAAPRQAAEAGGRARESARA
jgi:DNA-binding PadR family transcriptional regulator